MYNLRQLRQIYDNWLSVMGRDEAQSVQNKEILVQVMAILPANSLYFC